MTWIWEYDIFLILHHYCMYRNHSVMHFISSTNYRGVNLIGHISVDSALQMVVFNLQLKENMVDNDVIGLVIWLQYVCNFY